MRKVAILAVILPCLFAGAAQAAEGSAGGYAARVVPGLLPLAPGAGAGGVPAISFPATSTPPGISGPNGEIGTESNGAPTPSGTDSTPSGAFSR
ncbi:MAG: hypothetical protein WA870_04015 [Methylovirgula sp.]